MMNHPELLLHVNRGPLVESRHYGHLAVTDASGRVISYAGDPYLTMFARSAMKPIQAMTVLESGAAEHFQFSPDELALLCASHSGEEAHVASARSMLRKLELQESCLLCGPHAPYRAEAAEKLQQQGQKPGEVHNNCSGKHAGMLALAKYMGAPTEGYMEQEHPVQQLMLKTVSQFTDIPEEQLLLGRDGCGVPVYGLPLSHLAAAFAKWGAYANAASATTNRESKAAQLWAALKAHPLHLAGTDRFDTHLIQATGGRLIGKMGAEGVFALAYPKLGLGLALKVEDGTQRAIYPAIMEALTQLGWLEPEEYRELQSFHHPILRNWAGTPIGDIRPVFTLRPGTSEAAESH